MNQFFIQAEILYPTTLSDRELDVMPQPVETDSSSEDDEESQKKKKKMIG